MIGIPHKTAALRNSGGLLSYHFLSYYSRISDRGDCYCCDCYCRDCRTDAVAAAES